MAPSERKSTPELEVDVDAILQQLKQAKDKELRLRAEKERVRKELDALRTGDLWSRESATQRQLDTVQSRKRELQAREATEAERLKQLDGVLREKEVAIQKQRRPASELSAIKQAGSSVVGVAPLSGNGVNLHAESVPLATTTSATTEVATSNAKFPRLSSERDATLSKQLSRRSCGSSNQDIDAVDKLEFAIDLDKQHKRIQQLQEQLLVRSETMRTTTNTDATWEQQHGRQSPSMNERPQRRIAEEWQTAAEQEPREIVGSIALSPQVALNHCMSIAEDRDENPKVSRIRPRTPLQQAAPAATGPQAELIHPTSMSYHQQHSGTPYTFAAAPSVGSVLHPVYQPYAGASWPYAAPPVFPSAMAPYPLYSPSPMLPAFASPPYAQPYFLQPPPSFGYTAQPPMSHPYHQHPSTTMSPMYHSPQVERDVVQLQHQLNLLRKQEQQSDEDKEFAKVQEMLSGLQQQVIHLAQSRSSDSLPLLATAGSSSHEPHNSNTDPDLKSLKRQHMEAMLKVRNERDLLEEQDKLEETRERVEKRREERQRELHHDAWVTTQKQELLTLRLQRALTKLAPSAAKDVSSPRMVPEIGDADQQVQYDADVGVVIGWDFAAGLPSAADRVQLTFAVYDGKIPRTVIKALVSKSCEADGPKYTRAVFAAPRVVKPLPASADVTIAIEISSVTQKTPEDKPLVRRLGWTALPLFRASNKTNGELQLATGWWKARLRTTPMPDPSRVWLPDVAARHNGVNDSEFGDVVLHFRVTHGGFDPQMRESVADPDTHAGLYRYPDSHHPQQPDQQHPQSASVATAPPLEVTIAKPQAASIETTPATVNPNQDFLDVERLRLLSSSSATTRPPSGNSGIGVRPRSTLSASPSSSSMSVAPRNRLGAAAGATGASGLVPVLEDATSFDDTASTSPWIRADKSVERRRRLQLFQPGDAFNVSIDGARYLPDDVTVTKISLAALHADRSKISPSLASQPTSQLAELSSDACSPTYNLYVEYREKNFNPTLSLVMRVDTLDLRTGQPVILGYALFAVFLDWDSQQQPTRSNVSQFTLHEGAFQLPLYLNATLGDTQTPTELSVASAVASFPKIPCATLLIRVTRAATSEDGLQVLSRADVASDEWAARGIWEPAPRYETAVYDSSACIPSPMEIKMYQWRATGGAKQRTTVQQRLQQLGLSESVVISERLQTKPPTFMDLRRAFRYQPSLGFRIAIDGLHNIKAKAGAFCRVLFSVAPPAAFYQSIRLTSDVHVTANTDWTSLPTSPAFTDGLVTIRDVPVDPAMIVVIDVRTVTKNPKTGAWTSQPLAWSFLVVLDPLTQSVAVGNFQLPLFAGEVKLSALASPTGIASVVEEIAADKRKAQLPFMDGASVFVRLEDPQAPVVAAAQPLTDTTMSTMVPPKAIARYQYDAAKIALLKKKSPLSKLIPVGMTDKLLDKEINEALAAELGIHSSAF